MASEAQRIAQWKAQLAAEMSDDDDLDAMPSALPPADDSTDSDEDVHISIKPSRVPKANVRTQQQRLPSVGQPQHDAYAADLHVSDDHSEDDILNQTSPEAIGQFETAEEFNAMLLIRLEQQEDELTRLRKELKKRPSLPALEPGAPGEQKTKALFEQTKKNRALTQALGKERSKVANLTSRVKELEREVSKAKRSVDKDNGGSSAASNKEKSALASAEKESKQLASKVADQRIQITSLKAELQRTQRALQREVGDDMPVSQILAKGSNWKGRAEQLSLLRDQVRDLKQGISITTGPLATPSSARSTASSRAGGVPSSARSTRSTSSRLSSVDRQRSTIGQISNERRAEVDKLTAELQLKKEECKGQKTKYAAATSRVKILESDLKKLKARVGILLEKSSGDDELIDALRKQLDKFRKGGKSARGASADSRGNTSGDQTEDMLQHYKIKYNELTQQVEAQNQEIARLKLHNGGGVSKPPKSGATAKKQHAAGEVVDHAQEAYQQHAIRLISEERDAAIKAVDMYRRQYERAQEEVALKEQELNTLRRHAAPSQPSPKSKKMTPALQQLREVQEQLSLKEDENQALKISLQSTTQAKDQELMLYRELLQQHRDMCDEAYNDFMQRAQDLDLAYGA